MTGIFLIFCFLFMNFYFFVKFFSFLFYLLIILSCVLNNKRFRLETLVRIFQMIKHEDAVHLTIFQTALTIP